MRLLVYVRDPFPTSRPDIAALFGKYLPRCGVFTDLIAQRKDPGRGWRDTWAGGLLKVAGRSRLRALNPPMAGLLALDVLHADPKRHDAIQVRDSAVMGLVGLWAARMKRMPFYYWMSYPFAEAYAQIATQERDTRGNLRCMLFRLKAALTAWITYRILLHAADQVFVQSERMAQEMEKRGAAKHKLTVIPMAIDLETLPTRPQPIEDPRLQRRRIIAYLGALDRIRRPDFLLEVVSRLKEEFPDILLLLIGDAAAEHDRRWLAERIGELKIEAHVLQTGWLPMCEAWRWAAAAEIGLSPIPAGLVFDVSSPTKAIEYMALGKPVVATDIPDQTLVLQESGAGVVTAFDPIPFCAAVSALLRDPEQAVRMGVTGPAYVSAYRSYTVISQQLAARYRTLQAAAHDAGGTLCKASGRLR